MKRINNIYEKIYSIENLELACKKAQRGKQKYKEVVEFNKNKDKLLLKLQDSLINKTYKTSEYNIFTKLCGNKEREIYKLPFYPDRICQWSIMLQLENIFIGKFTKDTYSAIPNRGIHLALKRIKSELKSDKDGMRYCLKMDVKKYYPNIDHEVLKYKLSRIFKDNDLLWLLSEIIDSLPNGVGLPIGNYTSQYLSNFYLTDYDHMVKEKWGVKHYFRYMDDLIIFSDNKEFLHDILNKTKKYMLDNKLELKGNEQIFPIEKRGVDFVGYVIYPTHIKLRKSIKLKMKNKMYKLSKKDLLEESDICSINSYKSWLLHASCKNLEDKYITPLLNRKDGEICR